MFRSKKFVIIFSITAFLVLAYFGETIWSILNPYTIQDWQIDTKDNDWHISQIVSTNINDMYEPITDIARYQSALIEKTQARGLQRDEVVKDLLLANQQGPPNKVPVYIKTGIKDNKAIVIIIYRYGLGRLVNSLPIIKQFVPLSKRSYEQWVVVLQRDNNKIIYSFGAM